MSNNCNDLPLNIRTIKPLRRIVSISCFYWLNWLKALCFVASAEKVLSLNVLSKCGEILSWLHLSDLNSRPSTRCPKLYNWAITTLKPHFILNLSLNPHNYCYEIEIQSTYYHNRVSNDKFIRTLFLLTCQN